MGFLLLNAFKVEPQLLLRLLWLFSLFRLYLTKKKYLKSSVGTVRMLVQSFVFRNTCVRLRQQFVGYNCTAYDCLDFEP